MHQVTPLSQVNSDSDSYRNNGSRQPKNENAAKLHPAYSILWSKRPLLKAPRFHSIFHIAEDHSHEIFSSMLEFHVLELAHLGLAFTERRAKLERWARFLTARTPEEFARLADEDPKMEIAKSSLERLSSDPDARRLAEERELSQIVHQHYLASAFDDGIKQGIEQGIEQGIDIGRLEQCQNTVRILCEVFNIEFDEPKRQLLMALPFEKLGRFVERLKSERAWPTNVD